MLSEEWLKRINFEFAKANIPHKVRAFNALGKYSIEFGCPISFESVEAKYIFKWFKENTEINANNIGALFCSTYFYDGEFWELSIPVFCGTVQLNPFDSLKNMPAPILQNLAKDVEKSIMYVRHWADCMDFYQGVQEINNNANLLPYGKDFLNAGYQELNAATFLLRQAHPESRSIMNSRMAVEMFFKAYAGLKNLLTEVEAKVIRHNLDKGLKKMIEISGFQHLEDMKPRLIIYPEISDRYKTLDFSRPKLWDAFQFAQFLGALVIRQFIDYGYLLNIEKVIASKR